MANCKTKEGFVEIRNKNIYYKILKQNLLEDSNKDILIFLHEGLGSTAQWKDFPNIISEKLQLPAIIYDRQNYGKSQKNEVELSTSYLENEALIYLPELLNKLKLGKRKKILIGHSDGASISLIYAGTKNANVNALISIAAHVFVEDISRIGVKKISNNNDKIIDKLKKYHGDKADSVFNNWKKIWLSDEFAKWSIEDKLKHVKCRVLAVQGENDQYGTIKQLESIKKNSSGETEIFVIPNCSHSPMFEAKEIIVNKIISFISELRSN